ncbi:NAD(P)/FAD-dependent oxidoreductase [Arthrobacter sp. H14]|uniref:NAD(P)/FAD-dependent oxidoreductase n=1 Tax=Arthrobacter sp. H14 TaxID=1312959 RepID=UPI0004B61F81|nr:NAD(P)/FAD-dependent oxidoreductase [Arthrobacter sp. H14]
MIVGGGSGGLAAAMVLARARRSIMVIDAGRQNNLRTSHSGGVFLHDGANPEELYPKARKQLEQYPSALIQEGKVVGIARSRAGFTVTLADGSSVETRKAVLAQGMEFEKSAVPGIDDLWGTKVIHCPFCDGYEARNESVLAVGTPDWLAHMQIILPNWIDDLGWAESATIRAVRDKGGQLSVEFEDGTTEHWDKVMTEVIFGPRDALAASLGCKTSAAGHLEVDDFGQTSVPGVFAAGDQTVPPQQVNLSVGSGHLAGMGVVFSLSHEDRGGKGA